MAPLLEPSLISRAMPWQRDALNPAGAGYELRRCRAFTPASSLSLRCNSGSEYPPHRQYCCAIPAGHPRGLEGPPPAVCTCSEWLWCCSPVGLVWILYILWNIGNSHHGWPHADARSLLCMSFCPFSPQCGPHTRPVHQSIGGIYIPTDITPAHISSDVTLRLRGRESRGYPYRGRARPYHHVLVPGARPRVPCETQGSAGPPARTHKRRSSRQRRRHRRH